MSFMKSGKVRLKASVQAPFSVTPGDLVAVNPCIPVDAASITVRTFRCEETRPFQELIQMVRELSHVA